MVERCVFGDLGVNCGVRLWTGRDRDAYRLLRKDRGPRNWIYFLCASYSRDHLPSGRPSSGLDVAAGSHAGSAAEQGCGRRRRAGPVAAACSADTRSQYCGLPSCPPSDCPQAPALSSAVITTAMKRSVWET